ncbi:tripartite tricarboxylate transporter TctB family protein [Treponema primitia]|uniref:tripartite tricarboxylate transporter TctB family protein n=1 Tax=Treponema primitia TaxID=88058 RepID=UPI00398174FD
MKQKQFLVDRIFLIVLVLFFGIILQQSLGLTRTAGLMPKLVCTSGIILCALVFILGLFKEKALAKKAAGDESAEKKEKDWKEMTKSGGKKGLPIYITLIVAVVYFILFLILGFAVSSIIIMLVIPSILHYKKYIVVIPVAIISSLAIYFSFTYLFHISLPVGLVFQMFG